MTTYANAPLSKRDGVVPDVDDYYRKQTSQNMDHAADVKKKFKLSRIHKHEITRLDLGKQVINAMSTELLTTSLACISEDDILEHGKKDQL